MFVILLLHHFCDDRSTHVLVLVGVNDQFRCHPVLASGSRCNKGCSNDAMLSNAVVVECGHTCRLQPGTQAIDTLDSTRPSSWRRPRGRQPLRWVDQVTKDTKLSQNDAVLATHDISSWRSLVRDATCPATQAT